MDRRGKDCCQARSAKPDLLGKLMTRGAREFLFEGWMLFQARRIEHSGRAPGEKNCLPGKPVSMRLSSHAARRSSSHAASRPAVRVFLKGESPNRRAGICAVSSLRQAKPRAQVGQKDRRLWGGARMFEQSFSRPVDRVRTVLPDCGPVWRLLRPTRRLPACTRGLPRADDSLRCNPPR